MSVSECLSSWRCLSSSLLNSVSWNTFFGFSCFLQNWANWLFAFLQSTGVISHWEIINYWSRQMVCSCLAKTVLAIQWEKWLEDESENCVWKSREVTCDWGFGVERNSSHSIWRWNWRCLVQLSFCYLYSPVKYIRSTFIPVFVITSCLLSSRLI